MALKLEYRRKASGVKLASLTLTDFFVCMAMVGFCMVVESSPLEEPFDMILGTLSGAFIQACMGFRMLTVMVSCY